MGTLSDPLLDGFGVGGAEMVREPTMSDLGAKIAADLSMPNAKETLELLVAGKIVSLDLPIRTVYERLWRPHRARAEGALEQQEAQQSRARAALAQAQLRSRQQQHQQQRRQQHQQHQQQRPHGRDDKEDSDDGMRGVRPRSGSTASSRRRAMGIAADGAGVLRPASRSGGGRRSASTASEDASDIEDDLVGGGGRGRGGGGRGGGGGDDDYDDDYDDEDEDKDEDMGEGDADEEEGLASEDYDGDEHEEIVDLVDRSQGSDDAHEPMEVTFRICGLDGEATEDFFGGPPPEEVAAAAREALAAAESESKHAGMLALVHGSGLQPQEGLLALLRLVRVLSSRLSFASAVVRATLGATVSMLTAAAQCERNAQAMLELDAVPMLLQALMTSFEEVAARGRTPGTGETKPHFARTDKARGARRRRRRRRRRRSRSRSRSKSSSKSSSRTLSACGAVKRASLVAHRAAVPAVARRPLVR